MWRIPNIWQNEEVWIIGGGSSVIDTFNIPQNIVNKVRAKELPLLSYSPYMESIHNKHVIGVNKAFGLGDWVDMCFFGDMSFLLENAIQLKEYKGLCVHVGQQMRDYPWVKFVYRYNTDRLSIIPTHITFNNSSGAGAINLATLLGAKKIILVGFDMTTNGNNNRHWHNEYTNVEEEKGQKATFYKHLEPFAILAQQLNNNGVEIVNTSMNSAIKSIRKQKINEIL